MFKYSFLFTLVFLWSFVAFAQQKTKAVDAVYSTKAGAIKGYDPVAYFTDSTAVPGKPDISLTWNGATWHFSTEEHRTLFQQNPEKYAPAYGGWCAYGWSQGYPAKTDPLAWTIVDGKLYLNYDKKVRSLWDEKRPEYIQKADSNWKQAAKKQ